MRTLVQGLFAALVGYIIASALMSAGSSVTARHIASGAIPTTRFLIANVGVSFAAAVIGGYLCAKLAPAGGRIFALALLVLMFLGAAIVMWHIASSVRQPPGYLPLVTLLDVIALWTGAMIERASAKN